MSNYLKFEDFDSIINKMKYDKQLHEFRCKSIVDNIYIKNFEGILPIERIIELYKFAINSTSFFTGLYTIEKSEQKYRILNKQITILTCTDLPVDVLNFDDIVTHEKRLDLILKQKMIDFNFSN